MFLRNLKKIADPALKAEVEQVCEAVKAAKTLQEIHKLRKVEGCKKGISYRIRVGNHRIGVTIEGDMVTFKRFGRRDNFYNDFP